MRSFLFAIAAFVRGVSASSGGDDVGAEKCSLFLAKSTIEGAGLGVFTGVPLEEDAYVGFGDPAIPIVDIDFHAGGSKQSEDYHWLISEYVWRAQETGPDMTLEADDVSAYVTGLGSMPNCHFRLRNVAEDHNQYDTAGFTRSDPGIGASTAYHNRTTYTTTSVEAGQELFVDYGINWFLTRENEGMGLVPLTESYTEATAFMKSIEKLIESLSQDDSDEEVPAPPREVAMSDLWDMIKQFPYKSRPQSAIPKSFPLAQRAFEVGIKQVELEESIRSLDYLNSHGKCMDNIRPGISSIPHAGRGAFATRSIPKGGYVSIAPLVHIPDRDVLTIFDEMYDPEKGEYVRDLSQPTGHQLLLNYCFGHRSSSLLLCPYSPGTSYINHKRKSNAKIVWSTDPTYHNKSWLEEPVSFFDNAWNTGLAFEYIALEDINEGDEITIDYGSSWDDAWMQHVRTWKPPAGAETYISPHRLNEDFSIPIPTHDEDDILIGATLDAWCHFSRRSINKDSHTWQEHDMTKDEYLVQRIIDRTEVPPDNSHVYTVQLILPDYDEEDYVVENVPQKALSFYQKSYRTDMFVSAAFRHEMMIPDEMFPASWKNIVA